MKVVLITPYTGGNLGDAAIQEAVIANVRRRRPGVRFTLVSLAPEATARLHGVAGYAIGTTTFSPEFDVPHATDATPPETPGFAAQVAAVAKRLPVLPALWRGARSVARWLARVLGVNELLHVAGAFRVVRGAEVVVVSGGGQLDDYWGGPFRQPYALFKWGLLAKLGGARFVFLSVGYCTLSSVSRWFAATALLLADYRSYRDRRSQERSPYAPPPGDPVHPDLAFSYEPPARVTAPADSSLPVIGISLIAYLSRSWPERNEGVYENYVQRLLDLSAQLLEEGFRIEVFTSDAADRMAVDDFMARLGARADIAHRDRVVQRTTFGLVELQRVLDRVDYVVASRLHGVILAHHSDKPTVAISYDQKVDIHMGDVGLAPYCLDIHSLTTPALVDAVRRLVANRDQVRERLRDMNGEYAKRLQRQYDAVWPNLPLHVTDPKRREAAAIHD